jgi:phage terminase large subunit-like protein
VAGASKEASAALRFLPRLIIPEGRLAGKWLKLASYQKDFVRGAFAKGIEAGCLSIGRGNAKTALSAGIALGRLMGEIAAQPKREIILAARNREQAKTAFGFLLGFIQGLPEDQQEQFTIRRGSKLEVETAENGGGLARVIAAGGKSILGCAPTLAILDERAAWERGKGDGSGECHSVLAGQA